MPLPIGGAPVTALPLSLPRVESGGAVSPASAQNGPSFAERVENAVREVDNAGKTSQRLQDSYANGQQNDLHGTMIAMEQANISLRLLAQVRNKALEAYREVMRMGA